MEYNELILDMFQLECKLFMKMNAYHLIEQKCNKKCFNSNERQQLHIDIHYAFTKLIKTIKQACPSLTSEDIVFCCLTKLGLENLVIGRCMGSVSKQTVNQRKYRIKKKMKEAKCDILIDMIFANK